MEIVEQAGLEKVLLVFTQELTRVPIQNDRFTASFVQSGPCCGELLFEDKRSDRKAVVNWEVYLDGQQVFGLLRYNRDFVLLKAAGEDFRSLIGQALPVF